ncbi:MAG: hydroxymyristoyl-ACP dehydratase [Eubacteriaceae bacterium]
MNTINCVSNCLYQKNGKCTLHNVQSITSSASEDCAYFTLAEETDKETKNKNMK